MGSPNVIETFQSVLSIALEEELLSPFVSEAEQEQDSIEFPDQDPGGWRHQVRLYVDAFPGPPDRLLVFFTASGAQAPVYEAVRSTLGDPTSEKLLWHGTTWQSLL